MSSQTKSLSWNYFDRKDKSYDFDRKDKSYAMCKICKAQIKAEGSSTSSLLKHLRFKHPMALEGCNQELSVASTSTSRLRPTSKQQQPTITAAMEQITKYSRDSSRRKLLDDCIMKMIAKDMQPFSLVEDEDFQELLHALDPRYEMPGRKKLTTYCLPELYEKVASDVQTLLDDTKDIAITTDIWTSRKTEGYLTLTAHFISSSWDLKSVVLNTVRIRDSHTCENTKTEIQTVLDRWRIRSKVSTIVTDNGANIVSAAELLRLRHVPCFAHTLNLIVRDSLKKTNEVLQEVIKVKAIVSYFHHSVKASDKLQDTQASQAFPLHKLIIDVDTRWNSTMHMLQRYVEQHLPVTATLCLLSKKDMCMSDDDVALMAKAVQALEPFDQATTEMSSETEPTLSKMIPIITMLHKSIADLCEQKDPLALFLQSELRRRFVNLYDTYFVAASTLLDPSFKRLPFSEGTTKRTESRLSSNIMEHLRGVEEVQAASSEESEPVNEELEVRPPKAKKSLWENFDKQADDLKKRSNQHMTGPTVEMRRYLEMPLVKRGEDNPLTWWKKHQALFPGLSQEAKKLLNIPATSVPSERVFSKTGELISAKRSCLGESHIDKLIFLNKNC